MSYLRKRSSKIATLEAAHAIFFIIVGLAIAQSLGLFSHEWPPSTMKLVPTWWRWYDRSLIGVGYLVTALRFSHGVSQLYGYEKDAINTSGLPSSSRVLKLSLFLALLGILLYLMADNITRFTWFLGWTGSMVLVDFFYIVLSHVVRSPFKRLIRWLPARVLAALRKVVAAVHKKKEEKRENSWIDTVRGSAADAALEWMVSDIFVLGFCLLFLLVWNNKPHERLFAFILIGAGIADYVLNREFYFGGGSDKRKQTIALVCSPLKPLLCDNITRAQSYCQQLMKDEQIVPFASHAFYTYFLDNTDPTDKLLGRHCGLAFLRACDAIYVFLPRIRRPLARPLNFIKVKRWDLIHLSAGMAEQLDEAKKLGLQVRYKEADTAPLPDAAKIWRPLQHKEKTSETRPVAGTESRKRIYVCTKLRGINYSNRPPADKRRELERNIREALWYCYKLVHDENDSFAPFAPQAFYPYLQSVLDDDKWRPWLSRSLEFVKVCDAVYVYTDDGLPDSDSISEGMFRVIRLADRLGMEIQYRKASEVPESWHPSLPQFDAADISAQPKRPCVYFAAPLFTQGEWQWNIRLKDELEKLGMEVILPQDEAYPMLKNPREFDPGALFRANTAGIEKADLVLAILDQADPDSGTCWECGYAYKLGRPVLGLRTDIRTTGDAPGASVNLMLPQSCKEFLEVPLDKREDVPWVAARVVEAIKRIMKPGG